MCIFIAAKVLESLRFFIELSYNGKNYHGWQIQPGAISVQEVLERALSTLLRAETKVTGAGRTDTGVHARQIYAHFDSTHKIDTTQLKQRLNSFLPKDIAVGSIFPVQDDAHARFDAVEREYEYVISLVKDPFLSGLTYYLHLEPDLDLMNKAALLLLSHNDFQCFSRSKTDVKTYHCKVIKASWRRDGNVLIFTIAADRFLRNMVRAIVGTLLDVGHGKTNIKEFQDILDSKNRSKAGASAPAQGLFLTSVQYSEKIKI